MWHSERKSTAPDRVADTYLAFAKRNGAAGVRFDDLRHTNASELLRCGMLVKTAGRRLGHAQTTTTIDTYGHLTSGDDEKATEITQAIYGKRGQKENEQEGLA